MTIHVVIGPPCAGKSTHVSEHAGPDDVRIDYDALAQALGAAVPHGSTGGVRTVALAARQAAIDTVLAGIDTDAWIIHTRPRTDQLEAYANAGAEFIEIDPGKETCLARSVTDDRPAGTAEAIEDWYDDPPTGGKGRTPTMGATMLKTADVVVKAAGPGEDESLEEGQFHALVAVFNTVDTYGDVIVPGAFTDTLAAYAAQGVPVPVVWSHEWSNIHAHIGWTVKAEQTEAGLQIVGQLDPEDLKDAQSVTSKVYRRMKGRRIRQFSFAFDVEDAGWGEREGQEVFELRKLSLHEVGPCLVGVNRDTALQAIKAVRADFPRTSGDKTPDPTGSGDEGQASQVQAVEATEEAARADSAAIRHLDPASASTLADLIELEGRLV